MAAKLYVERGFSTEDPDAPHFWLFDGWREVDDLLEGYDVVVRK